MKNQGIKIFDRIRAYILCGVLSILIWILLTFFKLPLSISNNETAVFYLLSSISQALAALFALVFTVMLIMIQVFKKYSAWKLITSIRTIFYIITFSIAVIIPLVFLRFKYTPAWLLNGLVAYAMFCVISLIPFFYGVGQFLTGPFIYGDLEENILNACEIGAWKQAGNYLEDYKEIWLKKIKTNDKNSWDELLTIWDNIITRCRQLKRLFSSFFNISISLCYAYTKNKNEDYAIKLYESFKLDSNNILAKYGTITINEPKIYRHYIKGSIDILKLALKNKHQKLSVNVVKTMGKLILYNSDKGSLCDLLKINKSFVINIIKDESMLIYLDSNGAGFKRLTTFMEECISKN